jgi:hypothetical protein
MTPRSWVKALIPGLAAAAVYVSSFSGVFQFDDYKTIVNYARAHSFASWLYFFSHHIRPLLKLSYTLNWISGSGLFGFHLFNLAVHIINTVLVYFITLRFLSRKEYLPFVNAAFLAALLFGLHPIQTEAVTYISGRSVSLMTMFYLGSMLAYIKGTEAESHGLVYLLSPLLFILAVLTRETALTLPLALVLWEACCREEEWGSGRVFRRQAVHWGIFILIAGAVLMHYKYEELLSFSYGLRGIRENLLSQFNGLGYLLSRLIMINGLNVDPDIPAFSLWSLPVIMKAIFLTCLFILSLLNFKTRRWISFGILWFFLHLIPTNSIIPRLDIANERHMYLPACGLFIIIAVGIEKIRMSLNERRQVFHGAILALLIVLGCFTWARNNDYRSEAAFWEDAVLKSPNKARCFNNLGFAYELEGRYKEAKDAYGRAADIDPDFKLAKNNLRKVEAIMEGENE